MADERLGKRRKRGLSQAKAKKIAREGLSSAGNGFHSTRQRNFIKFVAAGGTPTRLKRRKRRGRQTRRQT